jgi:UDP:flavonoid glycosyltransferase YjiC (YdhE family)
MYILSQTFITVYLWIFRYIFLLILFRYYEYRATRRRLIVSLILAELPMVLYTIPTMLGDLIVYGTVTWFGIPTPFLVLAALVLLKFRPVVPREQEWLEEDKSWGPTINIHRDE